MIVLSKYRYSPCHPERSEGSAVRRQRTGAELLLRLKALAVAFLLLMLTSATSLCQIVQIVQNKVGKNAVISVTENDNPLSGANVFIDGFGAAQNSVHIAEGVTNLKGEFTVSGLPAGLYAVSVVLQGKKHWLGNLEVSPEIAAVDSRANYEMFPKFEPCSPPKVLKVHLQRLRGSVVDATEAVIPNVEIGVYEDGSQLKEPLVSLKTDKVGRFVSKLDPGDYIVAFSQRGFVSQRVAVALDPKGWPGMQLVLAIAASDCGNAALGLESTITEMK